MLFHGWWLALYVNFLSLGYAGKISQMPVILTPLHFDRDPLQKQPSCQRSVVIRTFITSDFMTGVPATPGSEIPVEVIIFSFWCMFLVPHMFYNMVSGIDCDNVDIWFSVQKTGSFYLHMMVQYTVVEKHHKYIPLGVWLLYGEESTNFVTLFNFANQPLLYK